MKGRIVLAPRGSDGDLYPFLTIGRALANAGHEVTVACQEVHRGKVERAGFRFASVRPDYPHSPPYPEGLFEPATALEVLIRRVILPHIGESYTDLLPVCRQADLIVGQPLSFAVPIIAERLRIPWMSIALQPMVFFSRTDPPFLPMFPRLYAVRRFGKLPYTALWLFQKRRLKSWFEPVVELRRELGLERPTGFSAEDSPMWAGTLAAFSGEFARAQPDWPHPTWTTGFAWPDPGRTLSSEVRAFLAKGEAPIVFTLGDSASRVPGEFYTRSFEAVRRLGCRAVFLTGGATRPPLPAELHRDQIFVAAFEPYAEVFPHAAAVVIPGGIGSIALALRASRPMLLTPLFFDQADNSMRAQRLGVGRVLEFRKYSAAGAYQELRELLSTTRYARQAAAIGSRIAAEDGGAAACSRIESVLERKSGEPVTATRSTI